VSHVKIMRYMRYEIWHLAVFGGHIWSECFQNVFHTIVRGKPCFLFVFMAQNLLCIYFQGLSRCRTANPSRHTRPAVRMLWMPDVQVPRQKLLIVHRLDMLQQWRHTDTWQPYRIVSSLFVMLQTSIPLDECLSYPVNDGCRFTNHRSLAPKKTKL
jgi:hypothetical protein